MAGRSPKGTPPNLDTYVNLETIAKYLGVNKTVIRDWVQEGMPKTGDHRPPYENYGVYQCFKWWHDREIKKAIAKATPTDEKGDKARLAKAKADEAGIKVAKLRAELITVPFAIDVLTKVCARLKAIVKAAESKYTQQLHGHKTIQDTQTHVSMMIDAMLDEFTQATDGLSALFPSSTTLLSETTDDA